MNESLVAFRREVLKRSVADLCRRSGWEGVTTRVMEVLVDLMEKYIMKLSSTAKAYSELYNRHTPNLTDMWLSYKQNGVDLSELNEYLENVEEPSSTYQVPLFPAPRTCLQNEEKSISKKDKHNKHKNDLPNSNITNSPSLTLERKTSGTNVQRVHKEKPQKAKSSSYQMKSILSLDSRVVDAGLPSINPSASRRVLIRPQHSIKDYPSSIPSNNHYYPDNHHTIYNDDPYNNTTYNNTPYNKYTKHYSDEDDYKHILPAELPKKHDEWEEDHSIEGRRHRKTENKYRKSTNKKHSLQENHNLSINKSTNFLPNKSKKIGRPSNTASQSTPTATLIASLKKTRKATIKEAFMSKKKLHNSNPLTHPLDSDALHNNKAVVGPTVMSNNNSNNDKYSASAFNFADERVKKKPGRKPKKKFGKVSKNSSFDNAYNNYNTNANLMDNVNNLHNNTMPSESLQNRTSNIVRMEKKEDGWCGSGQNVSKHDNHNGTNYHNSNNNSIGSVDEDRNGYSNTNTIGGKDEVKEEVVSCNDVSEEILPWTDAENSPDKPNNDENTSDNKHTDHPFHNNSNSFFNKNSFNNSSDNSFINVCDKSNSNINILNNDNPQFENYNSAPSKAWRQTRGGKDITPDVSKVTGLELILGSKQPNVQDSVNNSDPLHFDPNPHSVLGERISKKKGKKSKKQKKEARDARRLNNNLNKNNINNSSINNHTNPNDSNIDNYNNTTNQINNNDTNNSRQQEINLNDNKHNDVSPYRDNISYGEEVGDEKEDFLEDNLSTLVSVAVDERDKLHEVAPSNYNNNTLPSNPTFLQPSLSNTPLNKTYNTSDNAYNNLNTRHLLSAANISVDVCAEKKKKKKKSKKRKHDNELTPNETTKKPKMDEKPSLPKLTLKFGGNTVCGGKPPPKQPLHNDPPHSNRPKGSIKLVIKPFSGMRQQHSPSHHSNSSMLPSSRSQSPDDLARLAVGQRKADIYDSDHSMRRRSPIYSDSSSPKHTPLNALRNTVISSTPVLPSSKKSRGQQHSVITSTPISLSSRSLKPGKSAVGKTKRSDKSGKITKPNGEVIWICPTCGFPDNGSPMIGCDKCDDWYHWVCVNITEEPPEEVSWFCTFCISQASNNKNNKNNNNNNKRGRPPYKKK